MSFLLNTLLIAYITIEYYHSKTACFIRLYALCQKANPNRSDRVGHHYHMIRAFPMLTLLVEEKRCLNGQYANSFAITIIKSSSE